MRDATSRRTFNSLLNTNPFRDDTLNFLVRFQVNIRHSSPSDTDLPLEFRRRFLKYDLRVGFGINAQLNQANRSAQIAVARNEEHKGRTLVLVSDCKTTGVATAAANVEVIHTLRAYQSREEKKTPPSVKVPLNS